MSSVFRLGRSGTALELWTGSSGGARLRLYPNFRWSFDHRDICRVSGASLLEIFNGHPEVNVYGAPGKPSYEEIWDRVLSTGKILFGAATDDAHNYKDFAPQFSNPGRGWLMVQASELSAEAIVESLASGRFYSSSGVVLDEVELSDESISLRIRQERDSIYTTRFIGRYGTKYAEVVGTEAAYRIRGEEGYVRAAVTSSGGVKAWTQPVFLR